MARDKKAFVVSVLTAMATTALAAGCGGGPGRTVAPGQTATGPQTSLPLSGDDQSRCDFKGRADREVQESSGPGALQPNVRRVFGILGEGEDRRKVLFCREIDTNLDGAKDVVRTYNEKGDAVDEQADSNYDGKVDTWIRFSGGRISKVELDGNGDGRPDETRYYVKGKVSRIQRDTNFDGKPDVWEVYGDGQLERMGVDTDFDGHVDRWDRDEVARRVADEKEREDQAKAEAAKKAADDADKAASDKGPAKALRPEAAKAADAAKEAADAKAAAAKAAGTKPADAPKATDKKAP